MWKRAQGPRFFLFPWRFDSISSGITSQHSRENDHKHGMLMPWCHVHLCIPALGLGRLNQMYRRRDIACKWRENKGLGTTLSMSGLTQSHSPFHFPVPPWGWSCLTMCQTQRVPHRHCDWSCLHLTNQCPRWSKCCLDSWKKTSVKWEVMLWYCRKNPPFSTQGIHALLYLKTKKQYVTLKTRNETWSSEKNCKQPRWRGGKVPNPVGTAHVFFQV